MNVPNRIYVLVKAFNRVGRAHELRMYGRISPKMRLDLSERITNPRIKIMGKLKAEDKRSAFSNMDVLILPFICCENCPVAIHEAFMAGILVLALDIEGMDELVKDGKKADVSDWG